MTVPRSRARQHSNECPVCERAPHEASSLGLCGSCMITTYREGDNLVRDVGRQGGLDSLRAQNARDAAAVDPNPGGSYAKRRGFVYFLRQGGLVKIGFSSNPEKRQKTLGGGDLLATLPGYPVDERSMHDRFALLRMHGEWFAYTPALATYIEQIAAEAA
jgi:hypothetical protein